MAANAAALNWKQWLPTVDDAFTWAFLLGFDEEALLQEGFVRLCAWPSMPCIGLVIFIGVLTRLIHG